MVSSEQIKLIELRGGPANGRRMQVPKNTTEVSVPEQDFESTGIYRQSEDRAADGVEFWDHLESWNTGFSHTGVAPL